MTNNVGIDNRGYIYIVDRNAAVMEFCNCSDARSRSSPRAAAVPPIN
jgi:hypothetical protein